MRTIHVTNDELYEFVKLYDILRDMDFELTTKQTKVFEKNLIYGGQLTMSVLHHESLLETIYEEVLDEYPHLDEESCESIAKARFEDLCQ